jgi:hypothetical protein
VTDRATLTVYLKTGPVVIPLTGDAKNDALLERLARRSGRPLSRDGLLKAPDPDELARDAMREGM